jgi:hypothetical protein
MRAALVSTGGRGFPYHGVVIQKKTGSDVNHSLIRFEAENPEDFELLGCNEYAYFESYWKKDDSTKKTGVRGPIPWDELVEWADEKESNVMHVQELPFGRSRVIRGFEFCKAKVGQITYPHYQLLQSLLGVYWRVSDKQAFCSEFAAMVIREMDWLAMRYILRDGHRAIDMITPGGKKNGLKEGVAVFLKACRGGW